MLEGLRVVKCTLGVAHVEYTKVRIMHIMLNQILRYTTPTLSFVASPGRRRCEDRGKDGKRLDGRKFFEIQWLAPSAMVSFLSSLESTRFPPLRYDIESPLVS